MRMTRTFHKTGAEYPVNPHSPVEGHELVPRTFYPGAPVRGVTIFPIAFWPNPLPDFIKIKYSTTVA
jgi:hypothetical protein